MKYKGLIFDLDGVIVDTAKFHYLAWKRIASSLGFDFSEKDNEALKGVSRDKSLEILLSIGNIQLDCETKKELSEKKNIWYKEYIKTLNEKDIIGGAKEFIKNAKNSGYKLSVGSASKNCRTILNYINIENYFDAIVDGNMVTKAKPDPEIFLLCAKKLEIEPLQCIVFEDAISGVKAAKNAGMYAVGIGKKEVLKDADEVIPDFYNEKLKIKLF